MSCRINEKDSSLEFIRVKDKQDKFEVELPLNWQKEYISDGFLTGIISSDTSKELEETIIVNINWNNDTVCINSHLDKIIDSLSLTAGLKTKTKKLGRINNYKTCFNYSCGLDSLTSLQLNQFLYILKSDSLNGHILFTARAYGDAVLREQSELIAEIVESIKMK